MNLTVKHARTYIKIGLEIMIESDYNKKKVEIAQTSAVSESTEASKETENY